MNQELAQLELNNCEAPTTARGQKRRLALLQSATALFLERGYDAVSLDDIVQHAGGSKTSIYKYFGNKEGLFVAICDYRRTEFFKDIIPGFAQSKENLRSYLINNLYNFYNLLSTPEHAAFFRLIFERSQATSDFAYYFHEQGPKIFLNAIAKALENAHKRDILYCPEPYYSAQFYAGIIRELEQRALMGIHINKDDPKVYAYFEYCIDRFLEGHQKI
ncbi:TetR/AcrR family transcriptional regulator [Acinetobacter larvae]|uniref:TetR family transcriptional regulator n=1 Tax=Acinetobacter larvae TaxID=1789224 RepID=A0A1B2M0W9_9GAMM|nr:TetR/AcrR family transcriptional regulator [Acinetobacter larvae]AOA58663.1 TetR family transcriptional regulator [Acinetobacter larvae]